MQKIVYGYIIGKQIKTKQTKISTKRKSALKMKAIKTIFVHTV